MDGVNVYDNLYCSYRQQISGKKWYDPLFCNILNTSVIASCRILGELHGNKMSHLNVHRKITRLIKSMRISCPQMRSIHISCLLKFVVMDCLAFRHPSPKDDQGFSSKTLACIAQSVIFSYPEAEVLCAGICTKIQHIIELQIG